LLVYLPSELRSACEPDGQPLEEESMGKVLWRGSYPPLK